MRRTVAPVLFVLATALSAAPTPEVERAVAKVRKLEAARIKLAGQLAASVCAVFRGQGGGSGVIITKDGLALSNFHVTELDNEMRIGLNDQRIHPAVVLGVDPSGDLSLLRLKEKRDWTFTPLGDSDAMRQGDWVYAMGNPFLLATDFTPTITLGVVSGINRYQPGSVRGTLLYPDCIQTDASINPGNSGGPLFNLAGEVVGINGRVSLRDRGRVNIGVGYAISSNQIRHCLPEMRAGLVVEHGTLNATVRTIEDSEWPGGSRVTFDQMIAPGAAHDAGIQVGDALLEFQGMPITGVNQFSRLIAVLPKGRLVRIKISRWQEDGAAKEVELSLRLDGIPLIKKSQLRRKTVPQTYIEYEINRTLTAARAALQPIASETRRGKLAVTGREPVSLDETFGSDELQSKLGKRARVAKRDSGQDGDAEMDADRRVDLWERVDAWNDALSPDGLAHFKSVKFTGGALINGKTVDRFEVETKAGRKRVYFIQLDTGRIERMDVYSEAWVRWISIVHSKWQTAGGLTRPYKMTIWDREKSKLLQTIEYEAITR